MNQDRFQREVNEIKLIKEQFENLALEQGYESGVELYDEMNLTRDSYKHFKKEVPINKQTLKTLCFELGTAEVMDFVRFEANEKERYKGIWEVF